MTPRSFAALFSERVLHLLGGYPWGAVMPPRPPPPAPVEDARSKALEALAEYIADIVFRVPEPPGLPKAFRLAPDRIFVEWPDDANTNQLFPSIEFIPGPAEAKFPGLTPSADESSIDRFGPGTVLVPQHEHVERFQIEIRATTRSQRRLLAAGIEQALQPSEDLGGLRLRTDHYGQPARFLLIERTNFDDEDSGRRRRRATLTVEMGIDVVRLVHVSKLVPGGAQVVVDVSPPGNPQTEP